MLTHIHIRDFAIVERLDLELSGAMTALTGETGAGKSILVDALGLALGDRADSGMVRHGAERADVVATFSTAAVAAARAWLAERELDSDDECMIRRVVSRDGRSKGYINGSPVPMQSLKELGEMLVDIHGQHAHQSLMHRDIQRQLLDDYAGNGPLLKDLAERFRDWREAASELETLARAADERRSRLELLRYQVQELEALELREGEFDELEGEHRRLANAGRLLETVQQTLAAVYEGDQDTAHDVLGRAVSELQDLSELDARIAPSAELLNTALIQIQEGAEELRRYLGNIDLDPERLAWVEQRLDATHELARKHRVNPDDLPKLLTELSAEMAGLDSADARLDSLQTEVERQAERYRNQAAELSQRRRTAAETLSQRVTALITQLGMPHGRFEIHTGTEEEARFTPVGLDTVEFLISANPGQPPKPLNKVASGGELSRISLAIQVAGVTDGGTIPTLIFDEVDTGIGGGTAEIVGQLLHALGKHSQVLCVTHLPQVAAQAHHHLQVSKSTDGRTTRTGIRELGGDERIEELARMLGGVEITAQTRAHAREMMEKGQTDESPPRPGGGKSGKKRGKAAAG